MDAPLFSVRLADNSDIQQITRIVNHYILSSVATFRIDALSESAILETYLPIVVKDYIVAVAADPHIILGYAYASGYRMPTHKAYCHTAEITVFVHPEHRTRGVGSAMLNDLLFKLKNPGSLRAGWALTEAAEISEVLSIMALDPAGKDGGCGLRD
ncbi:hypothetical protein C8R44DRAFT_772530 [Mycena epipterygia]|nr:hypothetical protein C8R44DRAFT_772530 [Mycena epipterygia]